MKSKLLTNMIAIASLGTFTIAFRLSAQDPSNQDTQTHYRVVNLGTLGGTISGGNSINNDGLVTGFSNLTGDSVQHAAAWYYGLDFDLGTLGGPNSGVEWPVKNDRGLIAGISETSDIDPLGENWSCSYFFPSTTHHICVGFVWQWGEMTPLPTLGGYNGYAAGANNLGQVAGWAENSVHDPTCVQPGQVLQFKPVVWGPGQGQIQELPTFQNDPDGAATAVNDRGQVVGISGACGNAFGGVTAAHALLWDNGAVINLGSFGGSQWNTPTAINNRGDIVGFSDLPVDQNGQPNFHAFLWTKETGKMVDLGTLGSDVLIQALSINDRGQIVGEACEAGFTNCRAFLWEHGEMTDLNTLSPAGSALYLVYANDINDRGEITGGAYDANTGTSPAFLAIPRHHGDPDFDTSSAGANAQTVIRPSGSNQVPRGPFGIIRPR